MNTMFEKLSSTGRFGLIALVLAGLSCSCRSDMGGGAEQRVASPQAFAPAGEAPVPTTTLQLHFPSPESAVAALAAAAKAADTNDMRAIFGPESQEMVSPDVVQASTAFSNFVRRVSEKVVFASQSDTNRIELQLGLEAWPFPIPLVQSRGEWFFDTLAGREEILNRRIGMNELAAIRVCRAYVDAQREYASQPRNGDDVLEYARHFRSTTNTHDGLYWHVEPGEPPSPFGPLIVQSHDEGYRQATKILGANLAPYRGYCFQILTQQGPHAPAGKYSYIINGRMLAGFALVAWPAEWGNSGIMTFVVNQRGIVYQKNLGPNTAAIAEAMTAYDPDATWKPVDGD
jgi:hypothetical protein